MGTQARANRRATQSSGRSVVQTCPAPLMVRATRRPGSPGIQPARKLHRYNRVALIACHPSLGTNQCLSNLHTPRLANDVTYTKQSTAPVLITFSWFQERRSTFNLQPPATYREHPTALLSAARPVVASAASVCNNANAASNAS